VEYAFLVQACDLPGEKDAQAIAQKLAALNEPLRRSLDSFDNGGWHAVSHDVLQTETALIVTILIGRST
jgi:hypothetical protein